MSDKNNSSIKMQANDNGSVSFAADVIATIAGLAVSECEGVSRMSEGGQSFSEKLYQSFKAKKPELTKGVTVEIIEGKVALAVSIIVDYGVPIPDVAKDIQENVKKAVENMSGLEVSSVDVAVTGISFEKENKSQAELTAGAEVKTMPQPEPSEEPENETAEVEEAAETEEIEEEYALDLPEADEEPIVCDEAAEGEETDEN